MKKRAPKTGKAAPRPKPRQPPTRRQRRARARPRPTRRAPTRLQSPVQSPAQFPPGAQAGPSGIQTALPVSYAEYFGEPYVFDPNFKGPIRQRQCTDVICLFLFIAFIAGWAAIATFAYLEGRPETLVFPTDTEGNICGEGSKIKENFLYYFDLTKCSQSSILFTGCHTPQVCVNKCPSKTASVYYIHDKMVFIDRSLKSLLICKHGVNKRKPMRDLIAEQECGDIYFSSVPHALSQDKAGNILDYRNLTMISSSGETLKMYTILEATSFLAQFLSAKEVGQKMFMDVKTAWHLILIGLIFSMVLSFIWILFMRWLPVVMVWISIVLVSIFSVYALICLLKVLMQVVCRFLYCIHCSIALDDDDSSFDVIGISFSSFPACYYSVTMYIELNEQEYNMSEPQQAFSSNLQSYLVLKNTWMAFAVISGLVLAILLLMLTFLRKHLLVAIAMIKLASNAIGHMMSSLLFPVLPYVTQIIIFSVWTSVSVYLASSGRAEFRVHNAPNGSEFTNGSKCNPTTWSEENGECQFLAYGSGNNFLHEQLYNLFGLFWGLFFVTGITQIALSGAFASYYWAKEKPRDLPEFPLFLGLCRALRYHIGSAALGALLLAFVRTFTVVLEYIDKKLKKYNNKVARAILCVVILGKVTDFILLFGKLVIVGATAALSFHFFSGHSEYMGKYIPQLNYNLLPVVVIVTGSYFIASTFFSVYGMAVDTLFLCFLEDIERNDGSPDRPYFMSKELMKMLNKNYKDHGGQTHHT